MLVTTSRPKSASLESFLAMPVPQEPPTGPGLGPSMTAPVPAACKGSLHLRAECAVPSAVYPVPARKPSVSLDFD